MYIKHGIRTQKLNKRIFYAALLALVVLGLSVYITAPRKEQNFPADPSLIVLKQEIVLRMRRAENFVFNLADHTSGYEEICVVGDYQNILLSLHLNRPDLKLPYVPDIAGLRTEDAQKAIVFISSDKLDLIFLPVGMAVNRLRASCLKIYDVQLRIHHDPARFGPTLYLEQLDF